MNEESVPNLHNAAAKGHKEIVIELLYNGGDINLCDGIGDTLLMRAIANGHNAIAKMLINDYDADFKVVNKTKSALGVAALNNNKEMVKILLEKDNNDSDSTKSRVDSLLIDVAKGNEEIVEILVNDKRTSLDNINFLLKIAKKRNYPKIVEILEAVSTQRLKKNPSEIEVIESKKDEKPSELQVPKTRSKSAVATSIKIKSDKEIL